MNEITKQTDLGTLAERSRIAAKYLNQMVSCGNVSERRQLLRSLTQELFDSCATPHLELVRTRQDVVQFDNTMGSYFSLLICPLMADLRLSKKEQALLLTCARLRQRKWIADALERIQPKSDQPKRAAGRVRTWNDLEISVLDEDRLCYRFDGSGFTVVNCADMGFADGRKRPTEHKRAWGLLVKIAANNGRLPIAEITLQNKSSIQTDIAVIRDSLRLHFTKSASSETVSNLKSVDPLPFRRREGYKTLFKITLANR